MHAARACKCCGAAGTASSVAHRYISWPKTTHQLVAAAPPLHQAPACGSLLLARCKRTRPSPPGAPTPARSSPEPAKPSARTSRRRRQRPTRRACRASTSPTMSGTRAPSKCVCLYIYMHTSNNTWLLLIGACQLTI
jgi:hypothetical protein